MYNGASEAFYTELKKNARVEKIRGTIGSTSFDDSNIISMNITNRCSDTKEVSFGLAYVGQLQISLTGVNLTRGSWSNKLITVEFGLDIEGTMEWIPIGKFYVNQALWTDQGINITAYDAMTKFDKNIAANETTGTIYSFLNWACTQCSVTLGMTEAQCEDLPNGTEFLSLYPESDIKTYRDFIGWVAQTAGGFATINRTGALVVRSWADSDYVDTFTAGERIVGSTFSDFVTDYAGISIVNIEAKATSVYAEGNGVVINLGSNPLMQYGTEEVMTRQRERLATIARGIEWTPFTCSLISNPIYDLGDLVLMTGGVAGAETLSCCIMSINWTPKALVEFQGYGSDPALASGKSKTDKNISGLKGGGTDPQDKVYVSVFNNSSVCEIHNEWEELAHLRIGVMLPQTIQMHGVIRLNLSEAGIVYVRFNLDGDLLPFIHVCQFPVGDDTITLYLPIAIGNEITHDLKVEIMSDDGYGSVAVGDCFISLQGNGVTTQAWDGYIEIKDTYSFPFQKGIDFDFVETNNTDLNLNGNALSPTHSDSYSFPFQAGLGFGYSETQNTQVSRQAYYFRLTTEDGDNLTTEDGDYITTERS